MRKGMTALDAARLVRIHRELAEAYLAMGLKLEALEHFNKALYYLQECPTTDVGVAGSNPATPTSDLAGAPANFPTGSPQLPRFCWEFGARKVLIYDRKRGVSGPWIASCGSASTAQQIVDALNARVA